MAKWIEMWREDKDAEWIHRPIKDPVTWLYKTHGEIDRHTCMVILAMVRSISIWKRIGFGYRIGVDWVGSSTLLIMLSSSAIIGAWIKGIWTDGTEYLAPNRWSK